MYLASTMEPSSTCHTFEIHVNHKAFNKFKIRDARQYHSRHLGLEEHLQQMSKQENHKKQSQVYKPPAFTFYKGTES